MLTLYRIAKFLFRHVFPPWSRYPLVRGIARVVLPFNRPRREVIVRNLTPLIGAAQAKRQAPVLLGNFLMTAVDFFCPHDDLARTTPFENWSLIDKTYRKTKKVILVTAHLGTWELGISCLVEKGYSVAGVYAPYRNDSVVRWIMGHRNSEVEWIPAARGAAEACVAALEKGRVLGMVADIPFGEKGRRVMLAGTPAHLPLGPWAIAARAQATVIPVFIIRERPGIYRGTVHDPIVPGPGTLRKQMETMQDIYRTHLEHYLLTYPTQWGVLQAFWNS